MRCQQDLGSRRAAARSTQPLEQEHSPGWDVPVLPSAPAPAQSPSQGQSPPVPPSQGHVDEHLSRQSGHLGEGVLHPSRAAGSDSLAQFWLL